MITNGSRSHNIKKPASKDKHSGSVSSAPVCFNSLTFKYESQVKPTLKGINLKIDRGEKILIVGPSGSGKTTLGSCLNGLIPNSFKGDLTGDFQVAGITNNEKGIFECSKSVGTVLQDTDGQFVGLSVGEDIAFALENDCRDNDEMNETVQRTAAMVDMQDFLKQSPFELSGGQKQRVSLAGVLVDDVDILLFDEPLANLDPKTGNTAIELIDDIHKKTGKTIIIIEHRLEDVLHRPVDRIVLMEKGCIIADSDPSSLILSNKLFEKGIREPLYITAMKYAGCTLTSDENAAYLNKMELAPHRKALLDWYKTGLPDKPPLNTETLLSLKDVSYSYDGERKVLSNISFDLKRGEIISVLGNNGAGKSTLSKIITGLLGADSGSLTWLGENMEALNISDRSRNIGFVMQNPNHMISFHMIFDEVAFGLRLRHLDEEEIKNRVHDVLRLCGLYQFRNWPVSALSYGQKKRVTIAGILVLEPRLLILDEPTAGQDYFHYTEIMQFLSRLNQEKQITIMMVTHDMHLALEYTDRALVLSGGKIIADDRVPSVYSHEELLKRANLKQTSLYYLAEGLGLSDKDGFISCFINHERSLRKNHG